MQRRWWFAVVFALGLAPWTNAEEGGLAVGQLLVADRSLGDPNFLHTVVLLVQYDEDDGAMGLIVNRRTRLPLSRLFDDVKNAPADPVYAGGPVQRSGVVALVRSRSKPQDGRAVSGDVYLVVDKASLEKTLAKTLETSKFRAYAGYAGWGAGQLEQEMELGAWHILPSNPGLVFDPEPDTLWQRLIQQTDLHIARRGSPRPDHRVRLLAD